MTHFSLMEDVKLQMFVQKTTKKNPSAKVNTEITRPFLLKTSMHDSAFAVTVIDKTAQLLAAKAIIILYPSVALLLGM